MRYKIYCGPTLVHDLARRLSVSGFPVYLEGTEHVYVQTDEGKDTLWTFLGRQAYSSRDIQEVR